MLKLKQHTPGFTIVELLIVIVVIGILAAITIVSFNGVQSKARDTLRQSNVNSIAKSLELYYIEKGTYPDYGFQMESLSWTASTLKLPSSVVIAPGDQPDTGYTSFYNGTDATSNADIKKYGYYNRGGTRAAPTSCPTSGCTFFNIYWYSESKSAWQIVQSKNGG